jgi:ribulose-5-phosphate 4-epimerase/fuculose-1-phosphate aldolase
MLYPDQRAELYQTVLKLYQKDLIQLSSGNVSLRVSPDHLLITPSSVLYDDLTPKDLVIVDLYGNVVEGAYEPSSEAPMHTILHREMPDIAAVIHTHSDHALAFAVVGVGVPVISTESLAAGGPLPVAAYACPGTEAQGRVALQAMQGPPLVMGTLLRNHGVLAVGPSLARAFSIAYQIEMAARIYFHALQIGQPTELSGAQIAEIRETYAAKKSAAEKKPAEASVESPNRL